MLYDPANDDRPFAGRYRATGDPTLCHRRGVRGHPPRRAGAQQANVAFVSIDNQFSAGTVAVAKHVDGDAADSDYVSGLTYTIAVNCAVKDDSGDLVTVLDGEVTVAGDGVPVTVTNADGSPTLVPLGARCWGSEPASGGATAVTIDHDSCQNGAEVVAEAASEAPQELLITATNTFDPANIALTKDVVGEPNPNATYTFSITCTIEDTDGTTIDVPLLSGESPLTLGGGESATFDVLVGSTCTATEPNRPVDATLTFTETGSVGDTDAGDGVVTVGPDGARSPRRTPSRRWLRVQATSCHSPDRHWRSRWLALPLHLSPVGLPCSSSVGGRVPTHRRERPDVACTNEVPGVGFEPTCPEGRPVLSRLRQPVAPSGRTRRR